MQSVGVMENVVGNILGRDGKLAMAIYSLQEGSSNGSAAANATATAIINSLLFAESKSIRTSTIILAAFNVLAALATALSIVYDCYWVSRRNTPSTKTKKGFFATIHPAETFSLVLAGGIIMQGSVFAASQSTGLTGKYARGCATTAQFMLPAIFLVPFIQVVFGAECALRSLRSSPFPARGKWDVSILLGLIVLMEIGVWIPTHLDPEMDRCFASLVWFVEHFGRLSLILLSITGGLTIIFAIIIFYRLTTVASISQCQRIAASRMVYYLVLAVVSLTFVIPWFVTLTMGRPRITTSMMATVILNLTGLTTGLLQLFLRSNITTTSFQPRDMPTWRPSNDRQQTRLWGRNELTFRGHILQPVSSPRSPSTIGTHSSLIGEKPELDSTPMKDYEIESANNMPSIPAPTSALHCKRHRKKQSYSIFPSETISPTRTKLSVPPTLLPTSVFSVKHPQTSSVKDAIPGTTFSQRDLASDSMYSTVEPLSSLGPSQPFLTPPRPIFSGYGHKRDSSMVSSATVQIGLRLSNMLGPQLSLDQKQDLGPNNTYLAFGVPLRRSNSPSLQLQTRNLGASPLQTSTYTENSASDYTPKSNFESVKSPPLSKADREARMKTLPPVPRVISAVPATIDSVLKETKQVEQGLQLSPTVYSPLENRKHSPTAKTSTNKMDNSVKTSSSVRNSPVRTSPKRDMEMKIPSLRGEASSFLAAASGSKGEARTSKLDWI